MFKMNAHLFQNAQAIKTTVGIQNKQTLTMRNRTTTYVQIIKF
jgi:hypothetical protein